MNIDKVLKEFRDGNISLEAVKNHLVKEPFTDIGYAKIDNHREIRKGFPEVVYCKEKTPEQVRGIFKSMKSDIILGTKASPEHFKAVKDIAEYNEVAKLLTIVKEAPKKKGKVVVVSAGTSDQPIAEEAAITAELLGANVIRKFDIGVAGVHRTLSIIDDLTDANAIVAVAGMEGALPTILSGLTSKPVIAVPTSVGYGASFGGISALLTMLNSCSPGVAVVNIDNGFGAGYLAGIINKK